MFLSDIIEIIALLFLLYHLFHRVFLLGSGAYALLTLFAIISCIIRLIRDYFSQKQGDTLFPIMFHAKTMK